MNTVQLATLPATPAAASDCAVTATSPEEMRVANQRLIEWCTGKIAVLIEESRELKAAHTEAVKNRWNSSALKRQWARSTGAITFYSKIKAALEHGFYIVPNFPVTCFAIRTKKNNPAPLAIITSNQRSFSDHEQSCEGLPAGEGDYKNPFPEIWRDDFSPTDKPQSRFRHYAKEFRDLVFPINMARAQIMELTSGAMALKLFDDFGVLPSPYKKVDPMVVGRIKDPRGSRYSPKFVTFIIAWHLDTRTL